MGSRSVVFTKTRPCLASRQNFHTFYNQKTLAQKQHQIFPENKQTIFFVIVLFVHALNHIHIQHQAKAHALDR